MKQLKNSLIIIALLFAVASCKSTSDTSSNASQITQNSESIEEASKNELGRASTIFFDFDSNQLSSASKKTLKVQALWIKNSNQENVLIQGHCDERGSRSYNLALGKKRALAVKEYLIERGVDSKVLEIVSYGEDRPVVTGTGKKVWSKNRRTVTVKSN
jgi:peptidoglycan-associated lipoprotein